MAIYELSCDVGLTLSDVLISLPEAQIAQIAVEVLSDSDTISTSTQVAQIAVETLSKQDRVVNYTQIAQIALEVLSSSTLFITRWPHNLSGVSNANIASIIQPGMNAWISVIGTTL